MRSALKWQIPATASARFLNFRDGEKNLWGLRDDNVLVAIDRQTGKSARRDQSTLWRPSAYRVFSDRLYAFTADGLAYALRLLSNH